MLGIREGDALGNEDGLMNEAKDGDVV